MTNEIAKMLLVSCVSLSSALGRSAQILAKMPGIYMAPLVEYCCSLTSELATRAQAEGADAERVSHSTGRDLFAKIGQQQADIEQWQPRKARFSTPCKYCSNFPATSQSTDKQKLNLDSNRRRAD